MGVEATIGPWLGNLFYIVGGVYLILRMLDMFKRKPHVDVDFGEIKRDVSAMKETLQTKQDAKLCATMHRQMDSMLGDVQSRHSKHEDKISRQISGTHNRIDDQTKAIAANGATLETFMTEIRTWRNNNHA